MIKLLFATLNRLTIRLDSDPSDLICLILGFVLRRTFTRKPLVDGKKEFH